MAYDASNNNVNEPQQVTSSTPLSQSGPASNSPNQQLPQQTAQPSTISSSTGQSKPPQAPKPKKPSSGMFSNIQKYVSQNQPQAQKMTQAISKDMGNQAENIRQMAEQKERNLEANLAKNRNILQSSKQFAEGQIDIAGSQPLQASDVTKYQQITGNKDLFPSMNVDFTPVNQKIQDVQSTIRNIDNVDVRQEALKNAFSKMRPYTRGQRNLDDLLLGSADFKMSDQIGSQQENFNNLKNYMSGVQQNVGEYSDTLQKERQEMAQQVRDNLTGGEQEIINPLTQEAIERRELLQQNYETIQQKLANQEPLNLEEMQTLGIPEESMGLMSLLMTGIGNQNLEDLRGQYQTGGLDALGEIQAQDFADLQKFNFADYLGEFDPERIDYLSMADQSELDRLNALARLSGKQERFNANEYGIPFDYSTAMSNILNPYNVQYDSNTGAVSGSKKDIDLFKALLQTNALYQGAQMLERAPEAIGQAVDGLIIEPHEAAAEILLNPFAVGENINTAVDAAGNVVKTPTQVLQTLAPDINITDNRVLDAFLTGGLSEAQAAADFVDSGVDFVVDSGTGLVKQVFKPVTRVFCFAKGTPIHMQDGSTMNVEDLDIGHDVLEGRTVMGIGKVMSDYIFKYKGAELSGTHAVIEDGKWIRVEDSQHATKTDKVAPVYPIITEKHILITDNFISADFTEIDSEVRFSDDEQLEMLNSDKDRIEELQNKYQFEKAW